MEYTTLQLATLAGISARTLRYYDQIGLLTPVRNPNSDYRIYREQEVDVLQQILFYKELGFELSIIEKIMKAPDFDRREALRGHLEQLEEKEEGIRLLIETVKKTIQKEEGMIQMTDKEKFEGLKKTMLEKNEKQYGEEIQDRYGKDTVKESNQKFMNLTKEEYNAMEALAAKLQKALEEAVKIQSDPSGETGKEIAQMHKEWLGFTWSFYSVEAHRGLADMYVADERFRKHYDKNVDGCAEFLNNAICAHII